MDLGFQTDGIYSVNPTPNRSKDFQVYCLFRKGRALTVIQRRVYDGVDFQRNWTQYENGFGQMNGSFWLGLQKIFDLTSIDRSRSPKLLIELQSGKLNKTVRFAEYGDFSIQNRDDKYRIHLASYDSQSTAPDSLLKNEKGPGYVDGMQFSTIDEDNDGLNINCAKMYPGGWWFNKCHSNCLNCLHSSLDQVGENCKNYTERGKYLTWYELNECYGDVTYSMMAIIRQ